MKMKIRIVPPGHGILILIINGYFIVILTYIRGWRLRFVALSFESRCLQRLDALNGLNTPASPLDEPQCSKSYGSERRAYGCERRAYGSTKKEIFCLNAPAPRSDPPLGRTPRRRRARRR